MESQPTMTTRQPLRGWPSLVHILVPLPPAPSHFKTHDAVAWMRYMRVVVVAAVMLVVVIVVVAVGWMAHWTLLLCLR